jgi:GntR family transcriptional regulator
MRALHVDPSDSTPIWSQIEEGLRRLVASGALAPGAPVPSVRDLARELSINPATVAKAYQRLAEAGVLSVRRGDGTYVADSPPSMGKEKRHRALREGAIRYASLAATLGAALTESAEELKVAWKLLGGGPKGEDR